MSVGVIYRVKRKDKRTGKITVEREYSELYEMGAALSLIDAMKKCIVRLRFIIWMVKMSLPSKAQARVLRVLRDFMEVDKDIYIHHDTYGRTSRYEYRGSPKHRKRIRPATVDALMYEGWVSEWKGDNSWEQGYQINESGIEVIKDWEDKDYEGLGNENADMSAADILSALKSHYSIEKDFNDRSKYFLVTELSNVDATRRIDLFLFQRWMRAGNNLRITFEIKVVRSDFINEMKKPDKREFGLSISNLFYFVTPEGLIDRGELPVEAGLIEVTESGDVDIVIEAPMRDSVPPTWGLISRMLKDV
jgi:hypothetical protein